jgi:hypothetical protein
MDQTRSRYGGGGDENNLSRFSPEDGDNMFVRNADFNQRVCTVAQLRKTSLF